MGVCPHSEVVSLILPSLISPVGLNREGIVLLSNYVNQVTTAVRLYCCCYCKHCLAQPKEHKGLIIICTITVKYCITHILCVHAQQVQVIGCVHICIHVYM